MSDYNAKRGRDDDDDYYNERRPKPQNTFTIFDRLYFDIVEIGDPSRMSLTNRVAHAGTGFAAEVDNLAIRNGVLETFIATILEQPHKTPLVAAIILVGNSANPLVGQLAVEHVHSKIELWLKQGNYNHVKISVRLLACLEPIIESGRGVSVFLAALLDRAIELKHKSGATRSPLAEELFATVAMTLPYLGATLGSVAKRSSGDFDELLKPVSDLLALANEHFSADSFQSCSLLAPYSGDSAPYSCDLFLSNLSRGVNAVAENKWTVKSFINVAELVEPVMEKPESEVAKHVFPAVGIPEELVQSLSTEYLLPRVFFRAYKPIDVAIDDDKTDQLKTVPAPDSYDAVLWRDMLCDTVDHLDFNRKEAAKQLFTLDLFLRTGTFTGPGISIDKLSQRFAEDVRDDKQSSTYKVEDVASEAILAELFRLADPPKQPAYFHSLFIEACIMAPQAIAPVFGRAVRFLFANLRSFDVELLHRFLDWFSHHLSNFGFTWKWQEWVEYSTLPELDPRLVFIKQLIRKELRLSFESRIKETLPDELVQFVPEGSEQVPQYDYIEPENPLREVADQLLDVYKDKFDLGVSEEFLEAFNGAKEATASSETPRETLIDLAIGAAIFVGSRSLSLSQDWISRLSQQLSHVIESSEDESTAVKSVMKFYARQPHVGVIVLHFLLLENIISPSAIISYLFEADGHLVFTQNHGWECLIRTLDEVINESDVEVHAPPFKQVFDYLSVSSDDEWVQWWQRQVIKALVRKYVDVIKVDSVQAVIPESVAAIIQEYVSVRPIVPSKKVVVEEKEDAMDVKEDAVSAETKESGEATETLEKAAEGAVDEQIAEEVAEDKQATENGAEDAAKDAEDAKDVAMNE